MARQSQTDLEKERKWNSKKNVKKMPKKTPGLLLSKKSRFLWGGIPFYTMFIAAATIILIHRYT